MKLYCALLLGMVSLLYSSESAPIGNEKNDASGIKMDQNEIANPSRGNTAHAERASTQRAQIARSLQIAKEITDNKRKI